MTGPNPERLPISGIGNLYAGWKVVFLTYLLNVIGAGTIFYSYSVYAVSFATHFGASRIWINAGFTAVLVISTSAAFLVSPLIRRFGMVRVGLVGCVGTAIGLALVSVTAAMWQVLLLFSSLIALADTLIGAVLVNTLLTRWFARRRGLALGLTAMGASTAAIVFPPLTGALTEALGWRAAFVVNAGILLLLVPFLLLWAKVPDGPVPAMERLPDTAPIAAGASGASGELLSTREILRRREFWGITLAVATLQGLNGAVLVSVVPYAIGLGIPMAKAAFAVSAIGATAFFAKLAFGLLADRLDMFFALRLALGCAGVALVLLYTIHSYPGLLLATGILGLSLGGMLPVWGAIFAHLHTPADYPQVIGWSRTMMTPHSVGLPLLAGAVYDLSGSYQLNWLIGIALIVLAMAGTWLRSSAATYGWVP